MHSNIVGGPVDDDVKNWVEQAIANSTSEGFKTHVQLWLCIVNF